MDTTAATELARPTVSRAAAYIPQRQEDGLQFYAGAAYATYRQNGTLWVTNLRTGETHDTGRLRRCPIPHLHRR